MAAGKRSEFVNEFKTYLFGSGMICMHKLLIACIIMRDELVLRVTLCFTFTVL